MQSCDIGIIGLGLMGGAALHALTRRGCDVLGFDPMLLGEARGSSHGSCRIFRRFNFESEAYTTLSDRAYAGWLALEAESGRSILRPCPVLEAGPPGSELVARSRAAGLAANNAAAGPRNGREANTAFPAFKLPDDWDVVVQESGGILMAEEAMCAFRHGAEDNIIAAAAEIHAEPAGIRIITASGEVMARQVIVAAGPWIADLLPGLKPHLTVTRQAVGWFKPARQEATRHGAFPIFILEAARGMFYGFPDFEGRGSRPHNTITAGSRLRTNGTLRPMMPNWIRSQPRSLS
jgi:sarcosine oxidase